MSNFRTFDTASREPATPMRKVIDPAGWEPDALRNVGEWSYRLSSDDVAEIMDATARVRADDVALEDVDTSNFRLNGFAAVMSDIRSELSEGRGIVMIQGFPVEQLDKWERAAAYLGVGSYLGRRMSQNGEGHLLGHVKDLGADFSDPVVRGYKTRAALQFHTDNCDYVGLLCINTARSGGESMVASAVTVHNRMLERTPELVESLLGIFYRSRHGEMSPGEAPFYTQPMFTFHSGYFSAVGAGNFIDKAQALPGVPPLTAIQKEAIRVYRATAAECSTDIPFLPGDIQFLNNYVTLHARRGYEDWPDESRRRHLLRLWLDDPQGRLVPREQREGVPGRGFIVAGVRPNVPLDVTDAQYS